jgi:invasion protein IalB
MTGSNRIETQPQGDCATFSFVVAFLAVAASIASSQPAVSQQTDVAPRGQREATDVTYGDWRKLCFKPGGAQMHCRTSITGKFSTGQTAVRLDIIEREGPGSARLQIFSPVGMYLQKPVRLTVDQGQPHLVPYTWCLANACIAATVADPRMIQEMGSGQTLRLEFVDSNLLALTTSLPLAQFASANKGVPAETFEQDIDE